MKRLCGDIEREVNQEMQKANYAVSLSIGLVTYSKAPASVSEVLHQVDLEMYQHKMEIKSARA
ncbi:hypothetical protein [Polynucleobacter asymbioticus]|uniref:GGDEF domain-containing protein n=1 Tax=Polynucleobacter asymbioticus TaxID=576611 RepID=A0AAC9ISR0_9BURK|nr:hypothetical protein [Polynucleobacter asymbioticus]APB99111.1 hypothetical protein A4F89_07095 [Polynucleobacter asymbioticus]APC01411.1 hypothetical protein AOC25_07180 [Polynucleobacter asymbioticus]